MTIHPELRLRPWDRVSEVCRRILADLPRLARAAALRVREDLDQYAGLPMDEHLRGVTGQLRRRLMAIADRRPLDADDLRQAGDLAQHRARQGIPVDVLIGAYHLGDQEIWRELSEWPELAAHLSEIGSLMLESLHAVSRVFASAHGDVTWMLRGHRITLAARFVELLVRDAADGPEGMELAHALGFTSENTFLSLVWQPEQHHRLLPPDIRRHMDACLPLSVSSSHDSGILVVAQGASVEAMGRFARAHLKDGRVGIGLPRRGVGGASASISDARLALAAATREEPVAEFAGAWPDAVLLAHTTRLRPVLSAMVDVARRQPHLAEAVLALAEAGMSVSGAARAMHLHPNTVTYRLGRWTELTGMDVRTFDGLNRSRIACLLARSDPLP